MRRGPQADHAEGEEWSGKAAQRKGAQRDRFDEALDLGVDALGHEDLAVAGFLAEPRAQLVTVPMAA